jgi:hypothetical protein
MQRAFVLPGWGYWSTQQYRSIFGYAFPANGSRYAGFVALQASDERDADTLQKKLPGTSVMVRYDPENPDVSIFEEELIVGHADAKSALASVTGAEFPEALALRFAAGLRRNGIDMWTGGNERRASALRRRARRSGGRGWWIVGSLWRYCR